MNLENKKQLAIVLMAILLGLVAALLATNYVQTTVQEQTAREAEAFKQKYVQQFQKDMDAFIPLHG